MIRSVLHRLEKLENNIRPGEPPMRIVVQYISPKDMSVVGEYVMEVGAAPVGAKRVNDE